jgi:isopentenyl diphosphate isomerase/L-lactate dehydrogenase-like FMN-dependent dehydrogenase
MSSNRVTRRELLAFGGAPLSQAKNPAVDPARTPPLAELVNLLEFDGAAKTKLDPAVYAAIGGSDREAFDRMTLWPRVFVDSAGLNVTTEIFGDTMFAPIIVGPVGQQRQYHPEGEMATVQGAAAAKTAVVISSQSSYPIDQIAARAKTPLWYQVYVGGAADDTRARIASAAKAGCRAICLTVGSPPSSRSWRGTSDARPDWGRIKELTQGVALPVLLKGVMTPAHAHRAVDEGLKGVVVSNGGVSGAGPAPIEVLAAVVDAVGSRVPVLVDGSFRRGTDVIKALALGARAVLLGRPPIWGLAAYGADGVQQVLKLLQGDLARTMVNVGMPTIESLNRKLVKTHTRAST